MSDAEQLERLFKKWKREQNRKALNPIVCEEVYDYDHSYLYQISRINDDASGIFFIANERGPTTLRFSSDYGNELRKIDFFDEGVCFWADSYKGRDSGKELRVYELVKEAPLSKVFLDRGR